MRLKPSRRIFIKGAATILAAPSLLVCGDALASVRLLSQQKLSQRKMGVAAFSPKSVSGLVAWYRADLGVTIGTGVSQWADQSGNGNHLAQATGGNQPALNLTGGPNGTPAIVFTGASSHSLASTAFSLSQPMHFFWAAKGSNVGTDSGGIANANAGARNDIWDIASSNRWITFAGGSQQSLTATANTNHMFEYLLSGASSNKRLDGTDNAASPGTTGLTAGLAIGNGSTLGPANVTIAELCIYSAAISGADLAALRLYFATRYGLTT